MILRARSRIGKYRVVTRIASGGFARVYAAFDTIEGRRVALKVQRENASKDHVELFRKEIRLLVRLDHPHVLQVLNADEIDGRLVVAHPLGVESLAQRLHRRMSVHTSLDIFEQLLSALVYAHGKRILHCDVKPDNVILFDEGLVQLADFGLAREAVRTIAGSGSGTLGYMAPEQAMGRPSFRSDVFSAGLVLYRMLAGDLPEWPFKWPFPGVEKVRRKVSPEMVSFLRKALEVNSRKRFPNAVAMQRAYERIEHKTRR